jgi:putative endonuclease
LTHKKITLGRHAESIAADYFVRQGYVIIARNWRHPQGELDLVVEKHGLCVFVEVRSRTGEEFGHPLETIRQQKRAQVLRAARLYLDTEHPKAHTFRFDVVSVSYPKDKGEPEFIHLEDAFQADG